MTNCIDCEKQLVTEGAASGRNIRCSSCGSVFRFVDSGVVIRPVGRNRKAWWSFGLGISSILFSCLAGAPAIYLGISSLLGMRYSRPRNSDKFAAVAGTLSGLVFSLISSTVLGLVLVGVLFAWTSKRVTDPVEIMQIADRLLAFELPPNVDPPIVPVRGIKISDFANTIMLSDHSERKQRNILIGIQHIDRWHQSFNRTLIIAEIKNADLDPALTVHDRETTSFDWLIDGQACRVTRITGGLRNPPDTEGGEGTVAGQQWLYYIMTERFDQLFGIMLLHKKPASQLVEEDVKQFFESIRFVGRK